MLSSTFLSLLNNNFNSNYIFLASIKENMYKLCIVASAWGPPNQTPNASKFVQVCSLTQCLATLRPGFEVGSRTGTNVTVISVIHRVRTNQEIKMVMPKGGAIDPGGRADPISPNLLLGFAARCLLHNLCKISLASMKMYQKFGVLQSS